VLIVALKLLINMNNVYRGVQVRLILILFFSFLAVVCGKDRVSFTVDQFKLHLDSVRKYIRRPGKTEVNSSGMAMLLFNLRHEIIMSDDPDVRTPFMNFFAEDAIEELSNCFKVHFDDDDYDGISYKKFLKPTLWWNNQGSQVESNNEAEAALKVHLTNCIHAIPGQWTIGFSQTSLGEPWRVQMLKELENEAKTISNVRLIVKDAQNDTNRQRQQVLELMNVGIDLLIVSPRESLPMTEPIAKVFHRGIPVILLDRRVMGNSYTVFIGADNAKIAKGAAQYAAHLLKGRGNIVELQGHMGSSAGQIRSSQFREQLVILGKPIDVVVSEPMNWMAPIAFVKMEKILQNRRNIHLVYSHNDPGAYGAYWAAKKVGRENDIFFIGIDGLEGARYLVEDGILDASFEYPTGGREAIQVALQILQGFDVQKDIELESKVFTPKTLIDHGVELTEFLRGLQ